MGLGASSLPRSCKEDALGRAQMGQILSLQPAQGLEMDRPWHEGPEGAMTGQEGWWEGFPLSLACRRGGRAALSGGG